MSHGLHRPCLGTGYIPAGRGPRSRPNKHHPTENISPPSPLWAQRATLLYFFVLPIPGLSNKVVIANPSIGLICQAWFLLQS